MSERERTPSVQEAKAWYVKGYVNDDGLDELIEEALERREQSRGDAPTCDHCGEPLVRGYIDTNHGVYHEYECAREAQQERALDLWKVLLIAGVILFTTLGLVLFVPAPPQEWVPLVAACTPTAALQKAMLRTGR
jgi:hypothetical protein